MYSLSRLGKCCVGMLTYREAGLLEANRHFLHGSHLPIWSKFMAMKPLMCCEKRVISASYNAALSPCSAIFQHEQFIEHSQWYVQERGTIMLAVAIYSHILIYCHETECIWLHIFFWAQLSSMPWRYREEWRCSSIQSLTFAHDKCEQSASSTLLQTHCSRTYLWLRKTLLNSLQRHTKKVFCDLYRHLVLLG